MMSGRPLRILADDLTGALDCVAGMGTDRRGSDAKSRLPEVFWQQPATTDRFIAAFDLDTRNGSAEAAAERVARLAGWTEGARTVLKIDTLLRGHIAPAVATMAATGRFPRLVVAPAFPAMGRITRKGHQVLIGSDKGETPLGDLAALLRPSLPGMPVHLVAAGAPLPFSGLAICDAETQADMLSIAVQLKDDDLVVASAGLCREMGVHHAPVPPLPQGSRVVICGSMHPVTAAQIDCARARGIEPVTQAHELWPGGILRIPVTGSAQERLQRLRDALTPLRDLPAPGCALLTGGDTLHTALDVLGASSVEVLGEYATGLPLARILGGAWDGGLIVSKSGAFGGPGTLREFLDIQDRKLS